MAFRAGGFLRVDIAKGCGIAFRVFSRRNGVEMLRIDAGAIPASVIDDMPFGYGDASQK